MSNARNAYELVRANKLTACKRCGEGRLAWVQLKSGKWALTGTSIKRPVYSGENQHPEAPQGFVYANKLNFHNCHKSALLNLYAELNELKRQAYAQISSDGTITVLGVQQLERVFRHAEKFLLEAQ